MSAPEFEVVDPSAITRNKAGRPVNPRVNALRAGQAVLVEDDHCYFQRVWSGKFTKQGLKLCSSLQPDGRRAYWTEPRTEKGS